MSDNNQASSELEASAHLLQRLDADIATVHHEMQRLEIVFDNLKRSWLAISLAYKIVKDETKDR